MLNAFHHDLDGQFGGPMNTKPRKDRRLTDLIHRVNGVAANMACDRREAHRIQMRPP